MGNKERFVGLATLAWNNICEVILTLFDRFQSGSDAKTQNLTYINGANNAIIKVDNNTAGTCQY